MWEVADRNEITLDQIESTRKLLASRIFEQFWLPFNALNTLKDKFVRSSVSRVFITETPDFMYYKPFKGFQLS